VAQEKMNTNMIVGNWRNSCSINFYTTSKRKFEILHHYFEISVSNDFYKVAQKSSEITEIQGNYSEIIVDKTKKNYFNLYSFLFCEDTGLELDCLNGSPGPYVKDFMKHNDTGKIYELCEKLGNFEATYVSSLGFSTPWGNITYVTNKTRGTIVKPVVDDDYGFDRIFSINGEDSFSSMSYTRLAECHPTALCFFSLRWYLRDILSIYACCRMKSFGLREEACFTGAFSPENIHRKMTEKHLCNIVGNYGKVMNLNEVISVEPLNEDLQFRCDKFVKTLKESKNPQNVIILINSPDDAYVKTEKFQKKDTDSENDDIFHEDFDDLPVPIEHEDDPLPDEDDTRQPYGDEREMTEDEIAHNNSLDAQRWANMPQGFLNLLKKMAGSS